MDIAHILQKIAILNGQIKNSLVKKGSQLSPLVESIVNHINLGRIIYDPIHGTQKPDSDWHKAIMLLQKCKDSVSLDILNEIIADIKRFTKPQKLKLFATEWENWMNRDKGITFEPTQLPEPEIGIAVSSNNIQNLLKVATYLEKSADNINLAKIKVLRLINSHIGHIINLIESGNTEKAKEYLEVIRPHGWEKNTERNIDKLYEQVIKGLAEKLKPEDFQALGL
jgi:hypothetical protein